MNQRKIAVVTGASGVLGAAIACWMGKDCFIDKKTGLY